MNVASHYHLLVQCETATSHDVTVIVTNPSNRSVWRINGVRPIWAKMGAQEVAAFIVERYIHDHYSLRNYINFTGLQGAVERVLPLSNDFSEVKQLC